MKLSIIIPVYNNQKALSKYLASLSGQTIFDIFKDKVEVIIVDDGSTNCHFERSYWIPAFAGMTTENYKIEHSGASVARNFGYTKSVGEFVFFCDSDIRFLKQNALEKMIEVLEKNSDKAYCYSSFKYGLKTFKLFPFDREKLKKNNYISTMSLVRRSALEKLIFPNLPFDESLKRFQDWDLWLSLLAKNEAGIFLNEVLWQAKICGSISKWLPKIFYNFSFLKKVKEFNLAKEIVRKKHGLK